MSLNEHFFSYTLTYKIIYENYIEFYRIFNYYYYYYYYYYLLLNNNK